MPTIGSCFGWMSACVVGGGCIDAEAIGKDAVGCVDVGSEAGMPTYCCVVADVGVGVECEWDTDTESCDKSCLTG